MASPRRSKVPARSRAGTGFRGLAEGELHLHGPTPISGQREGPRGVLSSVDVVGGDRLQDASVLETWGLMRRVPGIQLTETRQGAESGKVSFRAFNGEGYLNAIKTLIDGIPSNVNSGNQRFIDMLFPLEISYIEVVRGTNDPRYGLHNIGGNVNFGTRQGGNYTDARLAYGSYNTRDAQLAIGREAMVATEFSTQIVSSPSGHEQRASEWADALKNAKRRYRP